MKLPYSFLLLLCISFNFSCKSQQYTFENLPEKQLVFGKGGGITGAVDTYVLLENGQMFHSNSITKAQTELEGLNKKETKDLFKRVSELRLSEIDFNHPGNKYYFLEDVNQDSISRITWGAHDVEVPIDCKKIYDELKTAIKK